MNPEITDLQKKLCLEYPCKVELHAHTSPASRCSDIPPAELVETYAKLGYSAVCITNHLYAERDNYDVWLDDYFAAAEAGKKFGINVILGAELRFEPNDNDYLFYGFSPEDFPGIVNDLNMTIEEFSAAYRRNDRFLCAAHPGRDGMADVDFALFDGIEAFNIHPNHNSRVALMAKKAHAAGMTVLAGTDYHHHGHEGLCAMRCRKAPESEQKLVTLLRSGDFIFEIGGSILLP